MGTVLRNPVPHLYKAQNPQMLALQVSELLSCRSVPQPMQSTFAALATCDGSKLTCAVPTRPAWMNHERPDTSRWWNYARSPSGAATNPHTPRRRYTRRKRPLPASSRSPTKTCRPRSNGLLQPALIRTSASPPLRRLESLSNKRSGDQNGPASTTPQTLASSAPTTPGSSQGKTIIGSPSPLYLSKPSEGAGNENLVLYCYFILRS